MRKPMTDEHRVILKKNYVNLVNEMQLEYMLPYFIQEGVLLPDMAEDIRICKTSFNMNNKLLQFLPLRGDRAFHTLLHALRYGSGQLHLVDMLKNCTVTEADIEEIKGNTIARINSASSTTSTVDESNKMSHSQLGRLTKRQTVSVNVDFQQYHESKMKSLRKSKPRRTSRYSSSKLKGHREQLPGIGHLFAYVTPHIHKKWRQLADELQLEESEISHIKDVPHAKQSSFAQMVLEAWLNKDRAKATKSTLIRALKRIGAKKALDSIAIYDIPKFKPQISKKASQETIAVCKEKVNKSINLNPLIDERQKKTTRSTKISKASKKMTGMLPIKCEVAQVESNSGTLKYTQKAFLDLAGKITDTMVKKGEDAVEILNTVERLQGIVFHKISKGSIIIETQVLHLLALERLWRLFQNDELISILEQALVSTTLLSQFSASDVKLTVKITPEDYDACKADLLGLYNLSVCSDVDDDTDYSEIDYSDTEDEVFEEEIKHHSLIKTTWQAVNQCKIALLERTTAFGSQISEFLMTLQLIHPLEVTAVRSITDLRRFQAYARQSQKANLSIVAIENFFKIYEQFFVELSAIKEKMVYLNYKFHEDSDVQKNNGNQRDKQCRTVIDASLEQLITIERMLQVSYDFSGLQHSNTVQMTTLETLGYRGLLSYFHVILDKLNIVTSAMCNLVQKM